MWGVGQVTVSSWGHPIQGYLAPAQDNDWFRFHLPTGTRVRLRLDDLPADFDLYLFDESGRFLGGSSRADTRPEEITAWAPAGTYYVRLVGYAGAWSEEWPYVLLVEQVAGMD